MINELVSMILKITRQQQIEIEEYCLSKGKTFSEYFVGLHEEKFREKTVESNPIYSSIQNEDIVRSMEAAKKMTREQEEEFEQVIEQEKKQRGRPSTKGK